MLHRAITGNHPALTQHLQTGIKIGSDLGVNHPVNWPPAICRDDLVRQLRVTVIKRRACTKPDQPPALVGAAACRDHPCPAGPCNLHRQTRHRAAAALHHQAGTINRPVL